MSNVHLGGDMIGTDRPMGPVHPFESWILAASALQGIFVLTGLAQPPSVARQLPPDLQTVWAILLALGGVAALAGLFWPGDPWTAVEVKRAGLVSVGFGALIYAVSAAFLGERGLTLAVIHGAIAVACFVRVGQVTKRLLLARAQLRPDRG